MYLDSFIINYQMIFLTPDFAAHLAVALIKCHQQADAF